MQSHNNVTSTTVLLLESVTVNHLTWHQIRDQRKSVLQLAIANMRLKMKYEKMKKKTKLMSWIDYSAFVI